MQFILSLTSYLATWISHATFENPEQPELPLRGLPVGAPVVTLEYATVVGSSWLGIDSFRGIPYAQPPVGNLRLKPPRPIDSNLGIVMAVTPPRACPQLAQNTNTSFLPGDVLAQLLNTPLFQTISNAGEDCLTVNVQRPSSANPTSKLPVVFWIYGGGFQVGSTATYDANHLISTSIALGKDIIYVSVNYRVGGFGFLPGKEMLGSGNLGLLDQRLGLEWVADNIEQFGGDPSKVTIWGQSAGSLSVFDQMALYNGDNSYKDKPLFRAALMESGSIAPVEAIDGFKGQQVYNQVVESAGCSAAEDTLECLRDLDYEIFLDAANSVPGCLGYSSVALSYIPRPDGVTLFESPEGLARKGLYAKVPFIIGDQEDEGTMFALAQSNISTTEQVVEYVKNYFFHDATIEQIQRLVNTYPDDPVAGSPFNTGDSNNIYPQYKRIAALLGDLAFTLSRRILLNTSSSVAPSVRSWSYLASYEYGTPVMGTYHASDIPKAYGLSEDFPSYTIQKYWINFINTMDPNEGAPGEIEWPQWSETNKLLHFGKESNELIDEDFRRESFEVMLRYSEVFRI